MILGNCPKGGEGRLIASRKFSSPFFIFHLQIPSRKVLQIGFSGLDIDK